MHLILGILNSIQGFFDTPDTNVIKQMMLLYNPEFFLCGFGSHTHPLKIDGWV